MKIIFMGTPDFAAAILRDIVAAGQDVVGVWTQPPAVRGRGNKLSPSAVHAQANQLGIPVWTPEKASSPESVAAMAALAPDVILVVAYGQILRAEVLDLPRLGCFNIHASQLPRWRGAAPIQRAIEAGDTTTGIDIIKMTAGLDEGPVLMGVSVAIHPQDTAGTLMASLQEVASTMAVNALKTLENIPDFPLRPQSDVGITYARKITKEEAHIDFDRPVEEVGRHIRAMTPAPGAWCLHRRDGVTTRLKIITVDVIDSSLKTSGKPGTLMQRDAVLIPMVACRGGGLIAICRLQREGKSPQDAADFLKGYPMGSTTQETEFLF